MSVAHTSRPAEGRRFSLLSLFEAMATPHQLDRYLELVTPMVDRARPARRGGRGPTIHRRHRHPHAAPDPPVARIPCGAVRAGGRRDRRGSAHPLLLTGQCAGVHRRTRRADVKAHPEGLVSQYLHAHASPGLVLDLSQAAGEFTLPVSSPSPGPADERRQRNHPGSVDAAHPRRRAALRQASLFCTTRTPKTTSRTSTSCAHSRTRTPNVSLVLVYTDQEAAAISTVSSARSTSTRWRPGTPDAETLPLRPARTDAWRSGGVPRTRHRGPCCTPRNSRPPQPRRRVRPAARWRSPTAVSPPTTPARRCSNRRRPPGSIPNTDAGWASASPAPP